MRLDAGRTERVRLAGIDAPEKEQASKKYVIGLAAGKEVVLRIKSKDKYGRLIADVILPDGRDLSHEIVRAGYAWWFRKYAPKDQALKELEAEARAPRRGLWADRKAMPPWLWRKQ